MILRNLIILLLIASSIEAAPPYRVPPQVKQTVAGGGGSCDDCSTANLLFSWHMEDLTVTEASDTPCGCSDGDTTGTVTSAAALSTTQAQDGTESLHIPTDGDRVSFDVSSSDLFNVTQGRIEFYVYPVTITFGQEMITFKADANNQLLVRFNNIGNVNAQYVTSGGTGTDLSIATGASSIVTGSWQKITVKWQTTGNPNLSVQIDSGTEATTNTDPGTMTAPTIMAIGDTAGIIGEYYIDNIKIYDSF